MDREYVRTCSAEQAAVLDAVAGLWVRVGDTFVQISPPTGRQPIDPVSSTRYVARVERMVEPAYPDHSAGPAATQVVTTLFGMYLDPPTDRVIVESSGGRRAPVAA